MEFNETDGSQMEDKDLEHVRGASLQNAMKNMAIGIYMSFFVWTSLLCCLKLLDCLMRSLVLTDQDPKGSSLVSA